MTVGTWQTQNFETQSGTAYKTAIDNNTAVAKRIADAFAPHAKATPDMNVLVDAGYIFANQVLTERSQQTVGPITAPSANPRIDRIVIHQLTGDATRVEGAEAGSPVAPAVPEENIPCAQIALSVGQSSITNANITDERLGGGGQLGVIVKNKVTANTTVANTTTETNLYSFSVAGGLLGSNGRLRLTIDITDLDLDVDVDLTVRLKFGTTTVASMVVSGIVTNGKSLIVAELQADNSASAQIGNINGNGFGTAAEDSSSSKNLLITVQFSFAAAANSITLGAAMLELLK